MEILAAEGPVARKRKAARCEERTVIRRPADQGVG